MGSTVTPFQNNTGPLAALENQGYSFQNFTYPIDLTTDPGEQHFVVFFIDSPTNTQYQTITEQTVGLPIQTTSSGQPVVNANSSSSSGYKQNIHRINTAIALYVPPIIQTSYNADWGSFEGGEIEAVAQHLAGSKKDVRGALKEFGLNAAKRGLDDAQDFLRATTGVNANLAETFSFVSRAAINPHLEMIFRGIDFRKFSFDFKFTPRSEQEALVVSNIIKAFAFYQAPEVNTRTGSPTYFIYPAEFDIEFYSNGVQNNFINKISTCAMTGMTVNYSGPAGWSAFRPGTLNGASVTTDLHMEFTETTIITKEMVKNGY